MTRNDSDNSRRTSIQCRDMGRRYEAGKFGGSANTRQEEPRLVQSSAYKRVKGNRDSIEKISALFRSGPCDVAKDSAHGYVYCEFPVIPGVTDYGNDTAIDEENGVVRYTKNGNENIKIGGKTFTIRSIIDQKRSSSLVKVASVCIDDTGSAEGMTVYYIQIENLSGIDDATAEIGKGSSGGDVAAQAAASSAASLQDSGDKGGTGDKKESRLVKRDRYGRMMPVRIIGNGLSKRYEAEGEPDADAVKSEAEKMLERYRIAADAFLEKKFQEGLTALTSDEETATLYSANTLVRADTMPWLGRCTFGLAMHRDENTGQDCVTLSVLPWNHQDKSPETDSWDIMRPVLALKDMPENVIDDALKGADKASVDKAIAQLTQGSNAPENGTTDKDNTPEPNPLLAAAQPQQNPVSQLAVQAKVGHSPAEPKRIEIDDMTPQQKAAVVSQITKTSKVHVGQMLLNNIVTKLRNAAGRDSLQDYKLFCQIRDMIMSETKEEAMQNGFAYMSKAEVVNKYTEFRTQKTSAQWILF